ncbi:transposase [Chitinispirillales bacterium ANBcel5]|uniref:transposase n=1 Tax=Cellulosispirillum alkaliphilum TaxID=3039283 RepID=UPI002A4E55E3|nr:transposase [Chitinispirillales bacterium ANBcel5]
MPIKARISLLGEIHHVMSRGIDGIELFRDNHDKERFLSKVGDVLTESGCQCFGYVLMDNHYQMILRPLNAPLSTIMRRINGSHARYYNIRHSRHGYLFQDRYQSTLVQHHWYIRDLIRHVHLDPLSSRLHKDLKDLSQYHWSGHSCIIGTDNRDWFSLSDTLQCFGKTTIDARKEYIEWLENGINKPGKEWQLIGSSCEIDGISKERVLRDNRIIGSPDFVNKTTMKFQKIRCIKTQLIQNRPSLSTIFHNVCNKNKAPPARVVSRGYNCINSKTKAIFCKVSQDGYGYTINMIAQFLDINASSVYRLIKKGTSEKWRYYLI